MNQKRIKKVRTPKSVSLSENLKKPKFGQKIFGYKNFPPGFFLLKIKKGTLAPLPPYAKWQLEVPSY